MAEIDPEEVRTFHDLVAGIRTFDFETWLWAMRRLQATAYGIIPSNMGPNELADYMMAMQLAAIKEIDELGDEMGWKPWSSPRGWFKKAEVIREAVDALHFIAHLLNIVGASSQEVSEEMKNKLLKNLQRQIDGYDVRIEKCEWCHTDLADHKLTSYIIVRDGVEHKFCKRDHAVAWTTREDR